MNIALFMRHNKAIPKTVMLLYQQNRISAKTLCITPWNYLCFFFILKWVWQMLSYVYTTFMYTKEAILNLFILEHLPINAPARGTYGYHNFCKQFAALASSLQPTTRNPTRFDRQSENVFIEAKHEVWRRGWLDNEYHLRNLHTLVPTRKFVNGARNVWIGSPSHPRRIFHVIVWRM